MNSIPSFLPNNRFNDMFHVSYFGFFCIGSMIPWKKTRLHKSAMDRSLLNIDVTMTDLKSHLLDYLLTIDDDSFYGKLSWMMIIGPNIPLYQVDY